MSHNNAGQTKGLTKYFRFSGILIFFAVMSFISIFLYIFAETFIKSAIEKTAGTMLGAEVNVASVTLQYSPLVLTINSLNATDADHPSYNMFSFKQAQAGIDIWQYLLGKTIIEQLNVKQLELMTKRNHVGEVYSQKPQNIKKRSVADDSTLPSVDLKLPNIKAILDDSNLLTVKAAKQLQTIYDEEKLKLKLLKEKLPTKAKLAVYKIKIKNISKMKVKNLNDFNLVKTEFDKIKKEFKADQVITNAAKEQFITAKQRILKQVGTLKNAPEQDWLAIERQYQLQHVNTEDFAHILFGEQGRGYYQKAESIYQRIAPFIDSDKEINHDKQAPSAVKGRFIHFDDNAPLPAFLIKQATLSLVLDQGDFEITIKELTNQHWYRNKASTIHLSSTNLPNGGNVSIDSQFEFTQDGHSSGQGQWQIKKFVLENMLLTNTDSLALTLTKGEVSGLGKFNVNQDNHINSNNHFGLTKASYQGVATTKFASILLDTFKSLDEFTLNINVDGTIKVPNMKLSSSLDDAVKGAFKKQIANKLSEFKTQINQGLNEKLAQSLQVNNQKNSELSDFEALLSDTDNALEQLKNSDVVKQQKKRLEDKVKDKLKDKLKSKLSHFFG